MPKSDPARRTLHGQGGFRVWLLAVVLVAGCPQKYVALAFFPFCLSEREQKTTSRAADYFGIEVETGVPRDLGN